MAPDPSAIYDIAARDRIREVLTEQHAVVLPELFSRIAEAGFRGSGINIDPHHIGPALRDLEDNDDVVRNTRRSRGGSEITTIEPANRRGRGTRIEKAGQRKRLLYARYLGWSQGSVRNPHGLIGPAGEQAVRSALLASQRYIPLVLDGGETSLVHEVRLSGPLDSAGYVITEAGGIPQLVTVLIEVKNLREWIYPYSPEIFQLLSKAVHLRLTVREEISIVPVFICRRAHITTFYMAKQLGFFAIDLERQYAGNINEDLLLEVRNELHFNDLSIGTGPSLRVRDRFREVFPKHAIRFSDVWRSTTQELGAAIEQMKRARNNTERKEAMERLRRESKARGDRGGW